jgi:exopolyphosphatase/guanosine-5'-triphosphate,3'-diphosphate pyrophosphatase
MKIAAIDIGSNSIKLLIAEPGPSNSLVFLRREKEVVRLGQETLVSGHLSSEAIVRAIRTIDTFRAIAESCGAKRIVATATAAVRESDNAAQFIKEAHSRTGVRIEILSGVEEARLIGLAATHGCGNSTGPLLNIDIGGGSTELSLMKGTRARSLHSMKIGAVRLTEQYLRSDPPKPKELEALHRGVRAALERPVRDLQDMTWQQVTGTSGTILAIGEAVRAEGLPKFTDLTDSKSGSGKKPAADQKTTATRKEIDRRAAQEGSGRSGLSLSLAEVSRFNRRIAKMNVSERKDLHGINEQRAQIVIAGGIILEETMRALKISSLLTCEWSLREGIVLDRLFELRKIGSVGRDADPRLLGAEALGSRFGYEERHGKQVRRLAEEMFDQLKKIHGFGEHERTMLSAAALLHDIGYAIAHESHHKHSLYLILHAELTGFTDRERLIVANIARYHRKAMPKPQHLHFSALGEVDRQLVWKLGGILRLADALDRSHQGRVRKINARVRSGSMTLTIDGKGHCDHEVWAVTNKKNMFEQAFDLVVKVKA